MGRLFTNSFLYILAYRYTKALESDVFSILGRIQSTHVLCSLKHAEEVLLKEANITLQVHLDPRIHGNVMEKTFLNKYIDNIILKATSLHICHLFSFFK